MSTRIAEASTTTLLMLRGLATLGQQFVNQRGPGFDVLSGAPLRTCNAALLGGDVQRVVLQTQCNLIPHFYAQGFSKSGRYNDSPILVDAQPSFPLHDSSSISGRTQYYCHIIATMTGVRRVAPRSS